MYEIYYTNEFKRQLRLMMKRKKDPEVINTAIKILKNTGTLPFVPYQTHKLTGALANHWEAHLEPDWLLIWKKANKIMILTLTNTGTHADLF